MPGAVALPPVVVTAIWTAPRIPRAGAAAAIRVGDSTANVAGVPPNGRPAVEAHCDRAAEVRAGDGRRVAPAGGTLIGTDRHVLPPVV
ncbi:hypothetical protein GCM10010464_14700 [Pseudonocardia yunnanensis]|uniref:Uncharacterized protein n=1 Tax=Pseudonocardia yunnanensis TaxID=58107 RepID=A0ABW4ESV8_9PSEU